MLLMPCRGVTERLTLCHLQHDVIDTWDVRLVLPCRGQGRRECRSQLTPCWAGIGFTLCGCRGVGASSWFATSRMM